MSTEQRKPLFIYDCDGTLEVPLVFGYAIAKSVGKATSLTEFKNAHSNQDKVVTIGMADLVKYTASLGNNVLLSGGDPANKGSKELKDLFPLFQNWKYDGKPVPFGKEPTGIMKDNPKCANALRKAFHPSYIVVIGDSITECELAKNIHADICFIRSAPHDILKDYPTIKNGHTVHTGEQIKTILEHVLSNLQIKKTSMVYQNPNVGR